MEEILVQFGNYGFPMVVAIYLLVRVEKKLDALTGAINRLEQALSLVIPAEREVILPRLPVTTGSVPQ